MALTNSASVRLFVGWTAQGPVIVTSRKPTTNAYQRALQLFLTKYRQEQPAALKAVTSVLGTDKVEFQPSPGDPANADAVLLAIGEEPYAEWLGDRAELSLAAADSALIAHYASYDVPIVVVLFSGRPMIISDELGEVSAFIAAFLPGSAGEGIADILFGDASPSAQLSMSWPKSNGQIPINAGDSDYASDPPLFPLGLGLRY